MDFLQLLLLFIPIALITTFLIKKYTKHSTAIVISVIKTERFNPLFEAFRKHQSLETLTNIGTILGFGAFGFDFVYGHKIQNKILRIGAFVLVFAILAGSFGYLFGDTLVSNPLMAIPTPLPYQIAFGLGGFSIALTYLLFTQAISIAITLLSGQKTCPGVAPVIPGVQIPNVPVFIPVEAWISLLAILIIHEASHGFLSRRHKIPIKNSGILLLGPVPIGAFVEPDEEQVKKMDPRKAVQIFAAGPTSNFLSMIIVLILSLGILTFALNPILTPMANDLHDNQFIGVEIVQVDQNFILCQNPFPSPAYDANIESGTRILSIDNNIVKTPSDVTIFLHQNITEPKKFQLQKDGIVFEKTLQANSLGRFGIQVLGIENPAYTVPENYKLIQGILNPIASIVSWFLFLSFLVALSNFLPAVPFDGGRIAELLFAPYLAGLGLNSQDTQNLIRRVFVWILVVLIIVNMLPLFI